jgi:hypothetical protein
VCATTIQSSGASANIRVILIENFHIIRFLSLSRPLSVSAGNRKKFVDYILPNACIELRRNRERNDDQLTRQLCLEGDKKVYGNKTERERERDKERDRETRRLKSHRSAVVDHPSAPPHVCHAIACHFFVFQIKKKEEEERPMTRKG